MTPEKFYLITRSIVSEAAKLRDAKTDQQNAPVNYACVFSQSEQEYEELLAIAQGLGKIVQETAMGPVFLVSPTETSEGPLRLIKIRKPDPKRRERGDADFTVSDYVKFKREYLGKPGFGIIERPNMEMIELADSGWNVLAYFSNPPLYKVLDVEV